MVINFSCTIYNRPVAKNHQSIQCDTCDTWVHRECNKINKQAYKLYKMRKISNGSGSFVLMNFSHSPIWTMKNLCILWKVKRLSLHIKQKSSRIKFFNKINTISVKSGQTEQSTGEINESENSKDSLNFLHLNISSLSYHFSELQTLLLSTKVNFDIIGISESRIKQNKNPMDNINLQNYNRTLHYWSY